FFTSDSDLKAYANWLFEASLKFGISIHAWVFMTNHVHLIMTPSCWSGISRTMQYLGRLYVRYFNFTYRRTGTLFEGRFKSSIIQDRHYLLACQRYIELNPVRAGMVDDPADYLWSSYRAHAFGTNVKMWTPHSEYRALGSTKSLRMAAYRRLFDSELDKGTIKEIRKALNTGLVLGNERFRNEIEQLTGQRQQHLKRGPKPKTQRED
ncbi:MAG: transposase, partial [Lysobacterales bacterium]